MGLVLKPDHRELIVATVPPSSTPTRVTVRSCRRKRENGSSSLEVMVEAPRSVAIVREPVGVDTDVAGGEG